LPLKLSPPLGVLGELLGDPEKARSAARRLHGGVRHGDVVHRLLLVAVETETAIYRCKPSKRNGVVKGLAHYFSRWVKLVKVHWVNLLYGYVVINIHWLENLLVNLTANCHGAVWTVGQTSFLTISSFQPFL
jgi:phage shock protein PspC (stress-responsive transcriptional regulator)